MVVKTIKKVCKFGLKTSFLYGANSLRRNFFSRHHKNFSLSWDTYKKIYHIPYTQKELKNHITPIILSSRYLDSSDVYSGNVASIFETISVPLNSINWHVDPLSKKETQSSTYFSSIHISENGYDVKGVWELSRFQHLAALAKAYQTTGDEQHVLLFVEHIETWLNQNPFLHGVNWTNPMESSIRAINWISAYSIFRSSPSLSEDFSNRFLLSLFDHALYIEHNWEKYLKNNNHYIADLLGFFYLCIFFKNIPYFEKRITWCKDKLTEELFAQTLSDGSTYEGSTNYHKLVMEMYIHFSTLCTANNIALPSAFHARLTGMMTLLSWCSDSQKNLIQIGDNDSGKITTGLTIKPNTIEDLKHFAHFGLTIIKTNNLHFSLRHPTYKNTQPSGHFHHDELSITLSFQGTPLFVDPGSAAYTANETLRNEFRSHSKHNGPRLKDVPDTFPSIFGLDRETHSNTATLAEHSGGLSIENYSDAYKKIGIRLYRAVTLNPIKSTLIIKDWAQATDKQSPTLAWSWILAPNINAHQHDAHTINLIHNAKHIATFTSSTELTISQTAYSPSYATIVSTLQITAETSAEKTIEFMLTPY
jgi:hypothetical protein